MTPLIINIMREQAGSPPEWSGDPATEAQEIARWKQWSVRKQMVESVVNALNADIARERTPPKATRRSR